MQLSVDDLIQLEGIVDIGGDEDGSPFAVDTSTSIINVDGVRFRFVQGTWTQWVGNWCWDAARMEVSELLTLLNHLMKSDEWTCTEAVTRIFEHWQSKTPLLFEHLEAELLGERA